MTATLRRLGYGAVIWLVGFLAGMLALAIPPLRELPPVPGMTPNPAISLFAIGAWLAVWPILSRRHLARTSAPRIEGRRLGIYAAIANIALDYLVIVVAFQGGLAFFRSVGIWLGYSALVAIPIIVGRRLQEGA